MFMEPSAEVMLRNGTILLELANKIVDIKNGSILDVGCGYGRLAYALHSMDFNGSYHGIDILKNQIDWLQ
jgi:2-polyprenyl-3-methyl-5-hydroxy-6-metoxy-1,4-benzoquinol methylase